jgi:hypothetical protein
MKQGTKGRTYDTGGGNVKGHGLVGGKERDIELLNQKSPGLLTISNRRSNCMERN